jgi:hypothetical protein
VEDDELQRAHRRFSAECFNTCWTLIDKADRTPDEVEEMLLLTCASLWHWKQRSDCQPVNRSIGSWQVSRVCALAGESELARRFAEQTLAIALQSQLSPFDVGYAHEALARAAALRRDIVVARESLALARGEVPKIVADEERRLLEADLAAIEAALPEAS